jgi:hypothetical protein
LPPELLIALNKTANESNRFTIGGRVFAEGPSGAPEWGIRFVVTPLFPTGGKRPPPQEVSYAK